MSSETRQNLPKHSSAINLESFSSNDSAISSETKSENLLIDISEIVDICDNTSNSDDSSCRVFESEECETGIICLRDQLFSKLMRDGLNFNIMAVGQTGIGKSTLLDSLFNFKSTELQRSTEHHHKMDIEVNYIDLFERGIKLRLGLIESKGLGDSQELTPDNTFQPIVDYIDEQFDRYLAEEQQIYRNLWSLNDTRIHVCLYLLPPNRIRSIDLITMKKLEFRTNLIPIIAKSDTLTKQELQRFKSEIMSAIKTYDIKIYNFPTDDPNIVELNSQTNSSLPFAVVTSNEFFQIENRLVRARQYNWGTVEVLNSEFSDFVRLRDMILRINMDDLKETTLLRYEAYRETRLESQI